MSQPVDPDLKEIGKKRGLEIWRIKKFALEKIPDGEFGNFYSGDSYIILYTKNPGEWNVHFWLGSDTSTDERGAAAIKTVELDQALGGLPTQYRETQNHESPLFLSYFKDGVKYLRGGVESGFNHVKDKFDDWKPRLFHCKGKRNVRCHQVECDAESLNLGDVFILDCGLDLYVWMPPESGRLERIKGMAQAKNIRDHERMGKPSIHVLDEDWKTNEGFWRVMGGSSKVRELKSAEAGGADENYWRTHKQLITLWRVSDETGEMKVSIVCDGEFKSEQLDSKDAFILDAGKGGIYVWIGKKCTGEERKRAMQWATSYLEKMEKPEWTQVIRVLEGAEPEIFTQWATSWEKTKARPDFQPKLYQCSDESGKLVIEEIVSFTQEDLDGDDVMILDGLSIVYVWVGKNANVNEKKYAEQTAMKYLETDAVPRPKNTMTEIIYQGSEGPAFKKFFKKWDDKLFKEGARSVENVRKLMFS